MTLTIPEARPAKMDRALILEEEVKAVIKHCESTGNKLYDPKSELYTGHLKIGYITYWVSYSLEGDAVRLANVYSHRMTIADNAATDPAHLPPPSLIRLLSIPGSAANQQHPLRPFSTQRSRQGPPTPHVPPGFSHPAPRATHCRLA